MSLKIFFIAIFLLFSTQTNADTAKTISGRVTRVYDGATLEITTSGQVQKVRLMGVLAPTDAQPYSEESKKALSDLTLNKDVSAWLNGGNYTVEEGRPADVWIEDAHQKKSLEINQTMLSKGAALCMESYCSGLLMGYCLIENTAKSEKRGIWALPKDQQQKLIDVRISILGNCGPDKRANESE